jgi:hypothetical protein
MSLLLIIGNVFLWSLLTIVSGFMGGLGLAGGFHVFKATKDWLAAKRNKENSKDYLGELEQQFLGGAATQES